MIKPRWWHSILIVIAWIAVFKYSTLSGILLMTPPARAFLYAIWTMIFVGPYIYFVEKKDILSGIGLGKERVKKNLHWTLFFVFFAGAILIMSSSYFRPTGTEFNQFSDIPYYALFLGPFIVSGLAFEVLYRGFLMERLLERGFVFSLIVMVALFTVHNIPAYMRLYTDIARSLAILAFVSVMFGVIYYYSRNIVGLFLIHGAIDATPALINYFGPWGPVILGIAFMIIGFPFVVKLHPSEYGQKRISDSAL